MTITNFTMINILSVFNKFEDKKLPQKISYAITRNIMELNKDYDCYVKELNKILKRYENDFIKDKDGNPVTNDVGLPIVDEEVSDDYNSEITELLNIEITVNLYTIQIESFDYDDEKYDTLSAKDIMSLQSILCKKE